MEALIAIAITALAIVVAGAVHDALRADRHRRSADAAQREREQLWERQLAAYNEAQRRKGRRP